MKKETLLVELLTEELPPNALDRLGKSFASLIVDGLRKEKLIDADNNSYQVFSTPRRLAISVSGVQSEQGDQEKVKKGPSVAIGLVDGKPSSALQGFLRSNNIKFEDLAVMHDGKQEVYYYEVIEKGVSIAQILQPILDNMVKKLPIPKLMHWGDKLYHFVRPIHGLVALFGDEILPVNLFGFEASRQTSGHRFMSSQTQVEIKHAQDYIEQLAEHYVIASFETRKDAIKQQVEKNCLEIKAHWIADESLFNEVTGLVEWPVVLLGKFEKQFLEVPAECLILTMQKNQKYFPLQDDYGKLLNSFLLVSNIESQEPEEVISGNERVVRARLSDAAFFYEVDKKNSLESRLDNLKNVIYHNKIGSQYARVERLINIAGFIAEQLRVDVETTQRVAQLAKADLATEMVGEFPELQGVMGKYYALNDKEPTEIAEAIEQHYWPKFANDALPHSAIGLAVSLADKLETLVGIWGIGFLPTGDKDPYGLRRAALGVLRMLLEKPLDLGQLLEFVYASFPKGLLGEQTLVEVQDFILTRLGIYLQNNYEQDVVAASLASCPSSFNQLPAILSAIEFFKTLPEASALASINKRISNILKKSSGKVGKVDESLFQEIQEHKLWQAIESVSQEIEQALQAKNYQQALTVLAPIQSKVDDFFENVMVMTDNKPLQQNRLNLLNLLLLRLNAIADISQLIH